MRWTMPQAGDRQTVKKFIWLPKTIEGVCRWMETVLIDQEFIVSAVKGKRWVDLAWADISTRECRCESIPQNVISQPVPPVPASTSVEKMITGSPVLDIHQLQMARLQAAQEKERRVHWQDLTYSAMVAVDHILGLAGYRTGKCTEQNFVAKLKEAVWIVDNLKNFGSTQLT